MSKGPARGKGRGGDARGYSWEPFEPGNLAAVIHGARSDALVEPRARELVLAVFEHNAHLDPQRDAAGVYRYAMALARCERVYAWLSDQSDPVFADTDEGAVHGVYERLERWERQAETAEDKLAISPLTRTRLGLDQLRGIDLAAALASLDGGDDE